MLPSKHEINVLRKLADQWLEIANLPVMKEKTAGWIKLNGLHPDRPMITIDQLPWNELNVDGSLDCVCTDPYWKRVETELRRTLFKYRHFPVDMVLQPYLTVTKQVSGMNYFGVSSDEDISRLDPQNSVVGHYFHDQLETDEAVDALKAADIVYHEKETLACLDEMRTVFDGVIEVRLNGVNPCNNIWDMISTLRGVENPLYDMMERPEFIHRMMEIFTSGLLWQLDQLEAQGLLGHSQEYIHCTGAFTDELPKPGFDSDHVRACDTWTYGLAQMLSTVSPAMFEEFEVDYAKRWTARFGLVYYGCCDPLDHKMAQVRKLPNVRKVSMSPWTDPDVGAANIGRDYVFSSKPSPALLAMPDFDEAAVEASLRKIKAACDRNGCPLEFILKDVSTVKYDLNRLIRWSEIANKIACE